MFTECQDKYDCKSQHCVAVCPDQNMGQVSYCIEANWFFDRHGLNIPPCIRPNDLLRKIQYSTSRSFGETCHNDINCETHHCVPVCNSELWKCIEPVEYFQQNKLDIPSCITNEARVVKQGPANKRPEPEVFRSTNEFVATRENNQDAGENAVSVNQNKETEQKTYNLRKDAQSNENPAVDSLKAVKETVEALKANEQIRQAEDTAQDAVVQAVDTVIDPVQEDLYAKQLEEEALEKLRQIDIKVMKLQEDAMKRRNGQVNASVGDKKKAGLFGLWKNSLYSYVTGVSKLFGF